uniref:MH2 domain-containing protein n=1 Tax=Panagrolaimus davidi TaxID=227884 RepID=A0A914PM94_9BILA
MELKFFGKGIKIQVDSTGNLWMKRNCDRRISVKTRQKRDPIILGDEYRKIFDLRIFKESIISNLNNSGSDGLKGLKSSTSLNKRLKESALIFLRFGDIPSNPTTTKNYLEAPLWCCLIHLIAFDMIGVIISEINESPRNSLQSFESHSCSTSTEESTASSSSYLPSNNSNNNNNNNIVNRQNNNKTGVARRIFQQRKPNHYQSPFAFEEALTKVQTKSSKPRSRSQTRIVPLSALPPSRPIETSSAMMNGWSLLNLSDIDKLRTPAYFASSEEAGAHRHRARPSEKEFALFDQKIKRRGKNKTPKEGALREAPPPPPPMLQPVGLTKYKWLSETCIRNAS